MAVGGGLAVALVLLVALAVAAGLAGRLRITRMLVVAATHDPAPQRAPRRARHRGRSRTGADDHAGRWGVPLAGIAIVPVAGIVIGGAMTATSQGGRRALDDLEHHRDVYEGALALGASRRDAAMIACRPAASSALVPPMDRTRTVGLVTLPGAFVGVLLGSGDAVQAAAAQVLVLLGLLAAETIAVAIAVAIAVELVVRGLVIRPAPPG